MYPPTARRLLFGALLAIGAFLGTVHAASFAGAQTPAQSGLWSQPFALPLIAIHAAVLPTGKVLLFSAEHGVPGIHGWLLDPASLALTNVDPPAGWNPDCAGNSFLPDGRLLVAGGTLQFNPVLGSKQAYLFDPPTESWVRTADMADGRWYPTCLTLPDGRVVTMSGVNGTNGALNPDIERWDAAGSGTWSLLGQKTIPDYPYLHVLSNGLAFRSGPDALTETYDPGSNTWSPVANRIVADRYEAPSVLLPPALDRVMVIGGYAEPNGTPTNSVEVVDLTQGSPQWSLVSHMQYPRIEHNAVLLPNATVLVVGGRSTTPSFTGSVLIPEVYDPASGTWAPLAPHTERRTYHSTAVLLPDGRVMAAGGDYRPSGEIFSPPYLFRGPRPTIVSAPAELGYGGSFSLDFTSTTTANTIVLMGLSAVTHSNNMGQRYVRLAGGTIPGGGGAVTIPGPASRNIAPPGYYMLFVVDANGVPSISSMVRVGSTVTGVPYSSPSSISSIELAVRADREIVFAFTSAPAKVQVHIVDVQGRIIKRLADKIMPPSRYSMRWDARDEQGATVASGIYFVRLRANGFVRSAKLVLVR